MHEVLFYLFAALTVIPALMLIFSRSTVNGAMLMIASFVGTAAMFALLQAYLLAVLQIMVYVGAVVVLFLFIVMLLGANKLTLKASDFRKIAVGVAFLVALAVLPIVAIISGRGGEVTTGEAVAPASSASSFGYLLFTKYQLPFELTGMLLLAAMIGVVYISRRTQPEKTATGETESK
jgi:NADH-quinone oxidoreductase subunit J